MNNPWENSKVSDTIKKRYVSTGATKAAIYTIHFPRLKSLA